MRSLKLMKRESGEKHSIYLMDIKDANFTINNIMQIIDDYCYERISKPKEIHLGRVLFNSLINSIEQHRMQGDDLILPNTGLITDELEMYGITIRMIPYLDPYKYMCIDKSPAQNYIKSLDLWD